MHIRIRGGHGCWCRAASAVVLFVAIARQAAAQQPLVRPDSVAERLERLVTSGDATRSDLLRLVVEFPLSPRVEDALVRLADDEMRSGDRSAARRHLELLVHDHLRSDRGAKAAQQLAQMMFDEGASAGGCTVLDSARAHVSAGNVELDNQLAYAGRRCEQIRDAVARDTIVKPKGDSALSSAPTRAALLTTPAKTPARTPARPSTSGSDRATTAPTADRRWSVQVAAYAVRGDALRLEARLKARGFDVRIVGDKPYRVRIGRFVARDSAVAIVAQLKAEKTSAIIVEAERP